MENGHSGLYDLVFWRKQSRLTIEFDNDLLECKRVHVIRNPINVLKLVLESPMGYTDGIPTSMRQTNKFCKQQFHMQLGEETWL